LTKDILVAILEDDVFSRNWMALLMVRDWRTRVIGEFSTRADLCAYLESPFAAFDILILDVDLFGEYFTIHEICQALDSIHKTAKILLTGIEPDPKIIREIHDDRVQGYVLKGEIGYSLSWVITFVHEGYWVLTPGVQNVMLRLPPNALILDGRKTLLGFTDHEAEVARMAFIFSVGRRDLADELRISEQWSYGLVSELYKKMGLTDIISGEVDLFAYIGESAIIRKKFDDMIQQLGTSKKARDMETLAYHLLTMPEIIQ
jgi:DNA-binding NarL/FixJ family response regulator